VASWPGREPVIDGCRYREALQAVAIEGGVANNVVPDEARITLNHRFAPDRDADGAWAWLQSLLDPLLDRGVGDSLELVASAAGAPPGLTHPVLADLVARSGSAPLAKLGWTDVSFFAERGIPATNFGPGDPTLAHTPEERVDRRDLERAHATLSGVLLGT
jgi:succinyl-diaminopimelate desuccinylase